MSNEPMMDVTDNDKLLAALGYPIWPVAVAMLLMEDKKNRPFIKYHAVQSLAFNTVVFIAALIFGCCLGAITFFIAGAGSLLVSVLWLVTLWPAWEAYNGKYLVVPYVTGFIKKQNWV